VTDRRLVVRSRRVVVDRSIRPADVVVEDGVIVAVDVAPPMVPSAGTIDVGDDLVAPGFIDLQLNGAFGADVTTEPARIGDIAAGLPRFGVTAFCPTVISCSDARRDEAIRTMREYAPLGPGAIPLGLHLEGPFLNEARRGAHPATHLRAPDAATVAAWVGETTISMVTLAPELAGARDAVARLSGAGVLVSVGHSDATYEQTVEAAAAGAAYVTHLFNATRPFGHRDPGVVGAALVDDRFTAGLIADGVHVHRAAVHMAWRALGPHRMNLVTDAVAVLGAPGGSARVGDVELLTTDRGVRNREGVLSGSNLSLDQAVRNLIAWTGCSLVDALRTVTAVPARLLRLRDRGRIATGCQGDLVVLGRSLEVVATFVGGRLVWGLVTR
jgi:N-acetylglucosamine-6-phosphate deacetylase